MNKVLSVSSGHTFDWICEHEIYSCPASWVVEGAEWLAPRNCEGNLTIVFRIEVVHILNPLDIDVQYHIPENVRNRIAAYVTAVQHIPGILDNSGTYRFYILSESSSHRLIPSLRPDDRLNGFVYFELNDLLNGKI